MNSQDPNSVPNSNRSNFKANLVLALLVLGVPLGTRLILQNAGAAASPQIVTTQPLAVPRHDYTATVVPGGRVLVAGGLNAAGVENSAEVFDPATGVSGLVGFMNSPRSGHTAIALADGRVFISGGNAAGTAEIYDPADGPLG